MNVNASKPKTTGTNGVTETSKPLKLTLDDGTAVFGYMQRYACDVNAPHLQVKKGDIVFSGTDHNPLANVVAWEYLKPEDIELEPGAETTGTGDATGTADNQGEQTN